MAKNNNVFLSYAEASTVVSEMGITSFKDYSARYKQCPGLPSDPNKFYGEEYKGWDHFIGCSRFYLTFDEARDAVIELGIKTWPEYKKRYKEDPMLPSSPLSHYGENYRGFKEYSSQSNPDRYPSMAKASESVVSMEIKGRMDYLARYFHDPLLPRHPPSYYSDEWKGWAFFLKI